MAMAGQWPHAGEAVHDVRPVDGDRGEDLTDEVESTPWERDEGIHRRVLYPYTRSVSGYHCPSDRSVCKNFRSYSMPDSLNVWWAKDKPGGIANWRNVLRLSQIARPSQAYVLLEENDPRGYNINAWVIDPTGGTAATNWSDPLVVWHGARSSFGRTDIRQFPKRCQNRAQKPWLRMSRSFDWKSSATRAQKPMPRGLPFVAPSFGSKKAGSGFVPVSVIGPCLQSQERPARHGPEVPVQVQRRGRGLAAELGQGVIEQRAEHPGDSHKQRKYSPMVFQEIVLP